MAQPDIQLKLADFLIKRQQIPLKKAVFQHSCMIQVLQIFEIFTLFQTDLHILLLTSPEPALGDQFKSSYSPNSDFGPVWP